MFFILREQDFARSFAFYFVWFIYKFVTDKLMPLIGETNVILIALIDRVRMLDNDLIRLNQKVSVVLQIKEDHSDDTKSKN